MSLSPWLEAIITGLLASVLFTIFDYLIQEFRYWWRLKRRFHNAAFYAHWKAWPNDVVYMVTLKVKRNKINFQGKRVWDGEEFSGQFIMNPLTLTLGEGYHTHNDPNGFGFMKIIIQSDECFLIEAPYTKIRKRKGRRKRGKSVPQAFIWRRLPKR